MFYVGQKVVFVGIEGSEWTAHPDVPRDALPVLNEVYTVAKIYGPALGREFLEIIELPRSPNPDKTWAHDARGFRPLVERPTDISIFQAMLNPASPQKVSA